MKINLSEIRKRVEEGLISEKKHPTSDLLIFNYTQRCQWEKKWDKYTLQCRGLITDLDGNIESRPFEKFFNLGENNITIESLPAEIPEITDKLDGSLGVRYYDDEGRLSIATRGSFESEQAVWATKWIREMCDDRDFNLEYTYLFEILYPENQIVVDYKDRKELVLLAARHIETGEEMPREQLEKEAEKIGINIVELYNNRIDELIENVKDLPVSKEGFVVKYSNGFRVKIKGEEYKRLHKLLTGISARYVWERLSQDLDIAPLIERVPDEFFKWVTDLKNDLITGKDIYIKLAEKIINDIPVEFTDRKNQALYIQKFDKELWGICFCLLDKDIKKANSLAWKMVKPSGKVFKRDIDNSEVK